MVERLETAVKWSWVGPALVGVVVMLISAWAVNMNIRVMKLEEIVVAIDKANVSQQGQYDTILVRLNIMSNRLETLVQQHIPQQQPNFDYNRYPPPFKR